MENKERENMHSENVEKRFFKVQKDNLNLRAFEENGEKIIEGYAIVYNSLSRLIWEWGDEFYEKIAVGAADSALNRSDLNVVAVFNHRIEDLPIARFDATKSENTLTLQGDLNGVKVRIKLANTTAGNDIYESVKRGDIDSFSFMFTVSEEEWDYGKQQGYDERTITKIDNIFDISLVTHPAFPAAKVTSIRSYEGKKENKKEHEQNELEKENEYKWLMSLNENN